MLMSAKTFGFYAWEYICIENLVQHFQDGLFNLTLQSFKEQPLCLQLVEEVGVDHEDGIVQDVAEGRADDQELATMAVWPWAGKQGVDACRNGLK